SPDSTGGGTPSGVIFNETADFGFMSGETQVASKFIFATEDGIIAAWGGGNNAVKVIDNSAANAVYKGLAIANDGTGNFLYVTNFKQSRIDVFDNAYNPVSGKAFHDPGISSDFGPFNIRNIGGLLYVTYAKHLAPDNHDDQAGPGNGFVDVFKPDGTWVKRFAAHGTLNSPWGIAESSEGFNNIRFHAILVGNFGDGRINVYDMGGGFHGQLEDHGRPISIDGLWGIDTHLPNADSTRIYFTAGPDKESHSLFGYLKKGN
ncbi:MAG TPA: TIGR03118 family protein, partial [Puia sp.]|nr:TIGR03118 family protein [Puia sp.]